MGQRSRERDRNPFQKQNKTTKKTKINQADQVDQVDQVSQIDQIENNKMDRNFLSKKMWKSLFNKSTAKIGGRSTIFYLGCPKLI